MASGHGSHSDTGAVVVYVTAPSKEVAERLADGLVENKLAACVNLVPGKPHACTVAHCETPE